MAVTRRGFLQLLGSSALVLQASPTSFFDMGPSVALGAERGYNSFLSIEEITRIALEVLHNNLTFAKHVNREYDEGWERLAERQLFRKGDIISFGAPKPFKVNPRTRMPIDGKLKWFLVEVEENG